MDISKLRNSLLKAKSILEDATCADLAPYPVVAIGQPVTCKPKKKRSGQKYAGVPVEELVEAGIGEIFPDGTYGVPKSHEAMHAIWLYKREHGYEE